MQVSTVHDLFRLRDLSVACLTRYMQYLMTERNVMIVSKRAYVFHPVNMRIAEYLPGLTLQLH